MQYISIRPSLVPFLQAWPFQSVDPTCNSSPPITLIHVYRDGVLGHIPANLLVELDLIQLAVGHIAPANIRCVEMGSQNVKYQRGETILPLPMAVDIAGDEDEIKCPNQTRQRFVVEETPIVSDILRFLERRANRPIPHLAVKLQVLSRYIQIALLVVFVSVELVNVCRYYTISDHSGAWSEMFLVLPIYTVLPMLPMSIPFLWYMMNAFGVAHILATYDMLLETDYAPQSGHKRHSDFGISAPQDNEIPVDDGWADEGEDSDSSLEESFDLESRSPTAQKHTSTFPATQRTEKVYVPRLFQVMRRVFQVWYGSAYATLPRSSSLFLEMGSITVVCTVDKEGVLSYPTPSVEKIFLPGSEVVAMDLLNVPEAKRDDITDADLDVTDNMEYSASEGRYTPSPDSRLPELARHPGLSPDESKTLGSNDILVNADTETNEHLKLSQSISVPANMALAKDPADRPALGRLPGSSFSAEHLRRFGSTSEQGKSVPKKHNDSRVGNGPMARVDMRVGVDSDMNESCEDECADEVVTPNVGMDGRWSPMTRGVGGEQETDTDMDVDGDVDVDRDGDRGRDLDVTERRIGGVTRSAGKVKMKESSGDRSTSVEGTGGATRLWGIWKGSGFVPEATDADGEAEETETDDAVGKKTKRGAKKSKKKWSRRQGDSSRDVTDRDSVGQERSKFGLWSLFVLQVYIGTYRTCHSIRAYTI
ncbi:hypothetical protein SARC_08281 [Sphaeroforma arctica JP610]|uniref:Uncharacterized protein n=1 Tax=Sphaeroforma arctica JP610 TaxID=667725 RepID=A0A0L0FRW4_9EUKA|nr:hypothetical protein SARC_08281 [Sphaeroforma arctica JP610]KNC79316.1 hypothetical protein SARC_08281 [Sphaeroforma arctica JP610]|eukprot:XP_014153218.1 hypothetical protein SARC_08281 [Sphaeroforma arctica JP610]